MQISVLQLDIAWRSPERNRGRIAEIIAAEARGSDLLVLPEMFPTGFTMSPEKAAEGMDGETVRWMRETAQKSGTALVGSLAVAENGKYYNRSVFAAPDGTVHGYDKRHLFRMAGEEKVYEAGRERPVIDYRGWRILPLVCYDLRFPVWARNTADDPYDLLIFVANWPEERQYAWETLCAARAIENQSYTVGCNRTGRDPKSAYEGGSAVYDFLGRPIAKAGPHRESVLTVTLDLEKERRFREGFPASLDADTFTIKK